MTHPTSTSTAIHPGGSFTLAGTSITLNRLGYGAMQLAGPGVFGSPRDPEAAIAELKAAFKKHDSGRT